VSDFFEFSLCYVNQWGGWEADNFLKMMKNLRCFVGVGSKTSKKTTAGG